MRNHRVNPLPNIYTANKADKSKEHSGVILYTDKTIVYQQVGKGQYVSHYRADFAKQPEPGETKSLSAINLIHFKFL
jgi:hypothetical protein